MKLRRTAALILVLLILLMTVSACGTGQGVENTEILVSAAASLTDVMEELVDNYKESNPDMEILLSFGSSGALQAQIEEGAPVDIFMSAAQKQMETLREAGLMLDDSIKTLLINRVVLVVPADSDLSLASFGELQDDRVKRIGIGDPGNVPVGQYSQEIFENLGLADQIEGKLVLANDVRTVLTWVESQEVDCGIVYATDAMTSDKVIIAAEAPSGSHKAVTYPAGIVKDSRQPEAAAEFLKYLDSPEAAVVFEKYGFTMN